MLFQYWQGRKATFKQQSAPSKIAEEKGIGAKAEKPKPIGISTRKGKPREELRRHYTAHTVKDKTRMVARILKGQKGAGRFAKSKHS